MSSVAIFPMVFGLLFVLAIIGLPFLVLLLIIWLILRAGRGESRGARGLDAQERELVQELHRGLDKMNQRVEALETILLEKTEAKDRREG